MEMNISSPLQKIKNHALDTQLILLQKRIYLWLTCLFSLFSLLFTGSAYAQPLVATDPVFYVDVYEQAMAINIREENLFTGGIPPVYITDIQLVDAPTTYSNPYYTNSPTCLYYEWTENYYYEPVVIDVSLVDGHGNTIISTVTLEDDGYVNPKPSATPVSNKVTGNDAPIFQAYSINDLFQPACQLDQINTDPQTTPLITEIYQNATFDFDPVLEMFATDANDPTGAGLMLHDSACGALTEPLNGMVSRNGNELIYTPDTDFIGTDTYEYCVTDQSYHPMGDDYLPGVIGTVEITVVPAGPPDLSDDSATTETNTPVIIDVFMNDADAMLVELVSNGDSDFDGEIELFTGPSSCPEVTTYNSGCIRYTPPTEGYENSPFEGIDSFTYTAGYSVDIDNTSTATVTVNVVPREDAPGAVDDDAEATAGDSVDINVLANDFGSNLSVFSLTEPEHGTAVIKQQPGGEDLITYTPDESYEGPDSFQYTITDSDNNTSNSTAIVRIQVAPKPITLREIAEKVAPGEVPVATTIDTICPMLEDLQSESSGLTEGQQKLLTRCSALIETAQAGDFSQIRDALGYISGEEIFSQGDMSVRILNTQMKNIGNRIAALRGGASGVSINGLGVVVLGEEEVNRFLSSASSMLGGGAAADEPEDALLADSRLSLFVNGTLNFGDTDPEKYQDGFNFDTLGITLGADYRLKDNLIIGGAIGFSDSEIDFNRNHGDMDSDSITLTTYGTYFTEKFYVDTLLGTGDVNFDTRRNLDFSDIMGGVKTTALSNTDGDQTLLSINMGYNFQKANWVISPYVGYDYLDSKLGAFIEKEGLGYGQGWELEFANQNVKSSLLITGLSFSFNKSFGFGVIVPHLRIAYKKELEDNVRTLDMQFVNDPSNTVFTISSDEADTGFINIATGLSFVTGNGFSGFVDYDVITAYNNLSSTTLTAGMRFERRF